MSDVHFDLPEALQWRIPIWWDPVPDWLQLRDDVRHKLVMTDLRAQHQIMATHLQALEQKMELIEQSLG